MALSQFLKISEMELLSYVKYPFIFVDLLPMATAWAVGYVKCNIIVIGKLHSNK